MKPEPEALVDLLPPRELQQALVKFDGPTIKQTEPPQRSAMATDTEADHRLSQIEVGSVHGVEEDGVLRLESLTADARRDLDHR